MSLSGGTTTMTSSSGLYEFTAYSGNSNSANSSGGAFYAGEGTNLTFGTTHPPAAARQRPRPIISTAA